MIRSSVVAEALPISKARRLMIRIFQNDTQDGEANKAEECFAEFVIPSSDSPPRNAGFNFNSVGGRCLPEGGAIVGFVANQG